MNSGVRRSGYVSPLREAQKASTRQSIVEAAGRLLANGDVDALSFAAVAREAGVKERTVYRHFRNKPALLRGIGDWYMPLIRAQARIESEEDLIAEPMRTFPAREQHEPIVRAVWTTAQGREFRLERVEQRKAAFSSAIAGAVKGLSPRQARWIAAVCHVLLTGGTWLTLKDYWGFSGEESGQAVSMATALLLNAVRAKLPPIETRKRRRT